MTVAVAPVPDNVAEECIAPLPTFDPGLEFIVDSLLLGGVEPCIIPDAVLMVGCTPESEIEIEIEPVIIELVTLAAAAARALVSG